jgi:hypothetical protein
MNPAAPTREFAYEDFALLAEFAGAIVAHRQGI